MNKTILFLLLTLHCVYSQDDFKCSFENKTGNTKNLRTSNNFPFLPDSNVIIRIPVVFHVYHHGEPLGTGNNLNEDSLKKAILKLNIAFSGKGEFRESVNTKIQFYLLKDSIGCQSSNLPQNGIKRVSLQDLPILQKQIYFSSGIANYNIYETYFNKAVFQLSPNPVSQKCLNIRLIPQIGLAAFVNGFEDFVLQSNQVMNSTKENSSVFVHELGHLFGLIHTFSDSFPNECIDGDGIADTDIHKIDDVSNPDGINECTGRRKGNVIYNFMSYGVFQNNFTPTQRDLMRINIWYSFPELFQNNPSPFKSPALKGEPISSCGFSSSQQSNTFKSGLSFSVGNLQYINFFEKNLNHIDYSCALKTEILEGSSVNFHFEDLNENIFYYIVIDLNNDGDFDDLGESITNGTKVSQQVSGSFVLPGNSIKNAWLRMRLIRTNVTNMTFCSTTGYGNAIDFSIKILPNCTKPNKPHVTYNAVGYGQSTTLNATNCLGTIKWYSKGEQVGIGNSINTPVLFSDTYYQTICEIGACESLYTTTKVDLNESFEITTISNDLCVNNIYNFTLNSTNSNYYFLFNFKKGNKVLNSKIFKNSGSFSYKVPTTFLNYLGGSSNPMIYGEDYNIQLEKIDNYTGEKITSNIINLNIGAIGNHNRIVENINEIYDINQNSESDVICPGKSKYLYGQVLDYFGKTYLNENLHFSWKKNGNGFSENSTNQIVINQPGNYSFVVTQAGCSTNSSIKSVNSSNYIINKIKIIGADFACEGISKEIYSDYSSTTAIYQWQKNGINIPNAVQKNYFSTETGQYKLIIQDTGCTIDNNKTINLAFSKSLPVSIYSQEGDSTICFANTGFNIQANGIRLVDRFGTNLAVSTEFLYQWQRNGIDFANGNQVDIYDIGSYRLIKKQGTCLSMSNTINITESTKRPKPKIYYNSTTEVCESNLNLQASFLSSGDWYKNNIALNNYSYFLPVYASGVYKYVVGAGTSCENESEIVNVSIGTNLNPKINYFDLNKRNLCGTNDYLFLRFDFSNTFSGFTYQWLKDGIEIQGGVNSQVYINSPGKYSLRITNGSCTSVSNEITVLNSNADLKVITSDINLECTNRSSKIEVQGVPNYGIAENFIWKLNGIPIPFSNSKHIYVNKSGNYTVEYNNNSGCVFNSNPLSITSGGGNISIPSVSISKGQSATLIASGCSNGSIRWYDSIQKNSIISTNNIFNSPAIDLPRSYYATCYFNGCENLNVEEAKILVSGCLENQNLSGIISPNGTYRANQKIYSTAKISDKTIYSVGKGIELLPGFLVEKNLNFEAKIGGCEN